MEIVSTEACYSNLPSLPYEVWGMIIGNDIEVLLGARFIKDFDELLWWNPDAASHILRKFICGGSCWNRIDYLAREYWNTIGRNGLYQSIDDEYGRWVEGHMICAYHFGRLHSIRGPAYCSGGASQYWVKGFRLTEEEFFKFRGIGFDLAMGDVRPYLPRQLEYPSAQGCDPDSDEYWSDYEDAEFE